MLRYEPHTHALAPLKAQSISQAEQSLSAQEGREEEEGSGGMREEGEIEVVEVVLELIVGKRVVYVCSETREW